MKQSRFYYGWTIVWVSFVTLGISFGIWYSFSVFFVAILKEFGWSRAATAGVFSVFMIVQSGMAVFIGTLLDRHGPRKILPLGSVLLVLGLLATSRIDSLIGLYIYFGVISGLGICAIGYPSHSIFLPKWFVKRRGLAIGIAMSGIGIGMQVLVPFIQYVISNYGWRMGFVVLALIVLVFVIPLNAIFQRKGPEEVGTWPDGREAPPAPASSPGAVVIPDPQWTLSKTLREPRYWYLFLTFSLTPMAVQGVLIHQVAHVVDKGFSAQKGAIIFGLVGIMGAVGKILFGTLSDKIGRVLAFAMGMGCTFLGVLSLMMLQPGTGFVLYIYAVFFGLGYGSIAPIFPAHAADLFYGPHFGRIYGSLSIGTGIGGALGTWFSGQIYDLTASYWTAFLIILVALVFIVVLFRLSSLKGRTLKTAPGLHPTRS